MLLISALVLRELWELLLAGNPTTREGKRTKPLALLLIERQSGLSLSTRKVMRTPGAWLFNGANSIRLIPCLLTS